MLFNDEEVTGTDTITIDRHTLRMAISLGLVTRLKGEYVTTAKGNAAIMDYCATIRMTEK